MILLTAYNFSVSKYLFEFYYFVFLRKPFFDYLNIQSYFECNICPFSLRFLHRHYGFLCVRAAIEAKLYKYCGLSALPVCHVTCILSAATWRMSNPFHLYSFITYLFKSNRTTSKCARKIFHFSLIKLL